MFVRKLDFSIGQRGPALAQALGMLAVAAGIGLWGALLLAPSPAPAPPVLTAAPMPGQDISPVSRWFGGGTVRLRVAVVGVIAAGQNGSALLSINGGPTQAYSVGQALAQGVILAEVLPHGVSLDQDGILEEITIPARPLPSQGFVPVDSQVVTASNG